MKIIGHASCKSQRFMRKLSSDKPRLRTGAMYFTCVHINFPLQTLSLLMKCISTVSKFVAQYIRSKRTNKGKHIIYAKMRSTANEQQQCIKLTVTPNDQYKESQKCPDNLKKSPLDINIFKDRQQKYSIISLLTCSSNNLNLFMGIKRYLMAFMNLFQRNKVQNTLQSNRWYIIYKGASCRQVTQKALATLLYFYVLL